MVGNGEKVRRTQAERRERVLESARRLFQISGFHECSIAAIADDSGVHVAQIYRDFESKEGLVETIVREGLGATTAAIAAALRGARERESVRLWLRSTIDTALQPEPGHLMAEIFAEAARNPAIARILQHEEATAREGLAATLGEYADGSRSPAEMAAIAEFLLTLIFGLYCRLATIPGTNSEDLVAIIERAVMAILYPAARNGPPPRAPDL